MLVLSRFGRCRRCCGPFFLDLGEQQRLHCDGGSLCFRMIMRDTTRLEDYRAKFGDAAATIIVEVHERKAGAGHRILQERDHRFCRKAILAAQMEKSADKAVAATAVIIRTAGPVAIIREKREHEIDQLHCF